MVDLNDIEASQSVKIAGATNSGSETNFVQVVNTNPSLSTYGIVTRQVPYEPPTFILTAYDVALANNKSMIGLLNPSGSDVVLKIQGIKIINNRTASTTGVAVDFRGKRITGLSGGTSLTTNNLIATDSNDTIVVGFVGVTNGAVSGESTADYFRRIWSSDEWGPGGVDVEAQDHAQQQLSWNYISLPQTKSICLRPNQGLTIKCVTNTTNGSFDFEIVFTQETL